MVSKLIIYGNLNILKSNLLFFQSNKNTKFNNKVIMESVEKIFCWLEIKISMWYDFPFHCKITTFKHLLYLRMLDKSPLNIFIVLELIPSWSMLLVIIPIIGNDMFQREY